MASENYCVQFKSHLTVLTTNMEQLLVKGSFSDVSLFSEHGKIPAHKIVLASCSGYFRNLFRQFTEEHPAVVIKDMSHEVLKQLLQYMYLGKVQITSEQLEPFMAAGKALKIIGLGDSKEIFDDNDAMDETVQNKELDLSRNGSLRQQESSTAAISHGSDHIPGVPKLIASPQAHLNPAMINHNVFLDYNIFNPAALAMRSTPQYLSSQLNSPLRASLPCSNLPKQSPQKSYVECSNGQPTETIQRDSNSCERNNRFSNSPEESTTSNASLDLTKASLANSPLNRINVVNHTLNSLATVGQTSTQSTINPVSVALVSKLQQYHKLQPQLRVSQSLLQKRSRSKSPPEVDERALSSDRSDRERSPKRFATNDSNKSPPKHNKQNSSGGSSSDNNNYSDEESGTEARDDHDYRDRSVSPGPSTSTPKVSNAFCESKPGYPLAWNYPVATDDTKSTNEHPGGTADILAALMQRANHEEYRRSLLPPNPAAFPSLAARLPPPLHVLPHTLATFPPLTNTVTYLPSTINNESSLTNSIGSSLAPQVVALMAEHDRQRIEEQRTADDRSRSRKRKVPTDGMRFQCDKCARHYASHGNLKRHLKYECGRPPTFECPLCHVKFQHRHSMKIHFRSSHKAEIQQYGDLLDRYPGQGRREVSVNPSVTSVPYQSPVSSSPLQIADKTVATNLYLNQQPQSIENSDSQNLPNTRLEQRLVDGESPPSNARTIATAEVSVASVAPETLDANFLALRRAQSQSSNTDV